MKAMLIGRHVPTEMVADGESVEIVHTKNVTFPATEDECLDMLMPLAAEMYQIGADVVLFQAIPGQLAAALAHFTRDMGEAGTPFGVIVSKPGERLAGVKQTYRSQDAESMKAAVLFANPRAAVQIENFDGQAGDVIITADPPMKFEFSHIEWF